MHDSCYCRFVIPSDGGLVLAAEPRDLLFLPIREKQVPFDKLRAGSRLAARTGAARDDKLGFLGSNFSTT
jgi:hypothetical protein